MILVGLQQLIKWNQSQVGTTNPSTLFVQKIFPCITWPYQQLRTRATMLISTLSHRGYRTLPLYRTSWLEAHHDVLSVPLTFWLPERSGQFQFISYHIICLCIQFKTGNWIQALSNLWAISTMTYMELVMNYPLFLLFGGCFALPGKEPRGSELTKRYWEAAPNAMAVVSKGV